jgi:hypothetical protein
MSNTLHQVLTSLLNAEQHIIKEVHDLLVAKGIVKGPENAPNPNQLELPLQAAPATGEQQPAQ